jgi:hypothetical protein
MIHPDFRHLPPVEEGTLDQVMRTIAIIWHGIGTEADPDSAASYAAFVRETDRQFAQMTRTVRVEFVSDDPYHGSGELFADLDARGSMRVYATPPAGPFHPVMTADENNRFRAVHDYYAHYVGRSGRDRNQFGPRGELAAWRAHLRMYSPLALPALSAETVAQNAWVNYGPHSDLPPAVRPYSPQKGTALHPAIWLSLIDEPAQLVRIGGDPGLWSNPRWRAQDGSSGPKLWGWLYQSIPDRYLLAMPDGPHGIPYNETHMPPYLARRS